MCFSSTGSCAAVVLDGDLAVAADRPVDVLAHLVADLIAHAQVVAKTMMNLRADRVTQNQTLAVHLPQPLAQPDANGVGADPRTLDGALGPLDRPLHARLDPPFEIPIVPALAEAVPVSEVLPPLAEPLAEMLPAPAEPLPAIGVLVPLPENTQRFPASPAEAGVRGDGDADVELEDLLVQPVRVQRCVEEDQCHRDGDEREGQRGERGQAVIP